jgi:hypothetical protein
VETGKLIYQSAAAELVPVTLELNGKRLLLTALPFLVPAIITAGHLIRRRIGVSLAGGVQGWVVLDAAH